MPKKQKVCIFFGGRSGEHAVSLVSAAAVMAAMDKDKYELLPVGITQEGQWLAGGDPLKALQNKEIPGDCFFASLITDPLSPGLMLLDKERQCKGILQPDVVFPVLHGTQGEDGAMQGLLELANLPYVGSGVLSSAVSMDKAVMKILFRHRGLPVGDFIYFKAPQWKRERKKLIDLVEKKLGYPCFIKPANLGSSVGISKAFQQEALIAGIEDALRYDFKVVVEAFIEGREIECSVLGDELAGGEPVSSIPGEIIPGREFYDYRAKYIDDCSRLLIPAPLGFDVQEKIKAYALEAYKAVECSGLGRVDFFYQEGQKQIFISEINTMPGFTSISMYPKLWEHSGIPFSVLIDRLITIALERHRLKSRLLTRFNDSI